MPLERMASISVVTPPAIEPITIAEAREHLRVDTEGTDTLLQTAIKTARAYVETLTKRALITRTLDVKFNCFALGMEIPRPPLQSVTSIKYLDLQGVEQTLDASIYRVVLNGHEPARIELAYNQSWPSVRGIQEQITVRIVTGFGDDRANVPEEFKQAIKFHMQMQFDQDIREGPYLKDAIRSNVAGWVVHYL